MSASNNLNIEFVQFSNWAIAPKAPNLSIFIFETYTLSPPTTHSTLSLRQVPRALGEVGNEHAGEARVLPHAPRRPHAVRRRQEKMTHGFL